MDTEHIKLSIELHGLTYLQFGPHIQSCKDLKSYKICKFFRCASFQNWLDSLPELLSSPTVPSTTVKVLTRLACQNNPLFYRGLCQKVPDILSKYSVVGHTLYLGCTNPGHQVDKIFVWWQLRFLDPQYEIA
jgi:hypothetical protein